MKVKEVRELSHDEIVSRIVDTRKQIVEMRFALAVRKLESPAKLRNARKSLARLLTIQSEKVRAEGAPEKAAKAEAAPKAPKAKKETAKA
ncbi:MAG: 50S ribosomal protein L29 [Cyanobacteria bacterium SZAS-4]|nr:50S ribosomal protein L29 [Cyanobacteria bacterium SZAS-4]